MTQEEFTARYMPQFSEQQKAAVMETEGPVLLLAVPGSAGDAARLYGAVLRHRPGTHSGRDLHRRCYAGTSRTLYRTFPGPCRANAGIPHDQRAVS